MKDYIDQHHSKTAVIKNDFQPELELVNEYEHNSSLNKPSLLSERLLFGRGRGRIQTTNTPSANNPSIFSRRLASNAPVTERKFVFSQRLSSLMIPPTPIDENTTKTEEKSPDQTLITYKYNKPFIDKHLCYLLGPGKQQIIEKDQCQIFSCLSLGYCRVRNNAEGKEIEKSLYSILPHSLNIDILKIPNDLQLIICSSAAESVFQQSKILIY
jgi:hypothetical protein